MRTDPSDGRCFLTDPAYYPFGECSSELDRFRLVEDISKDSGHTPRNIAVFCDLFMSSSDLIFTNPFNYIEQSTRVLELEQKLDFPRLTVSCNCKGACEPETCTCLQLNAKCFGDVIEHKGDGRVADTNDYCAESTARSHNDTLLVMCGPFCGCGDECKNHINKLMKTDHRFEIFRRNLEIGFGARILNSAEIGDVICEVVGSIVPVEHIENDERKSRYSMELYSKKAADAVKILYEQSGKKINKKCELKDDDSWYIDTLYGGNISRFINHACFSNVAPIRVVANYLHPVYHRIFLLAVTPILSGCELLLNYDNLILKNDFVCKCNSLLCLEQDPKKKEFFSGLSSDEFAEIIFDYYKRLSQGISGVNGNFKRRAESENDKDDLVESEADKMVVQAEDGLLAAKNASYFAQDDLEMNIRMLRTVQNAISLPVTTKSWQYQSVKMEWERYDTEIENLQEKIYNLPA